MFPKWGILLQPSKYTKIDRDSHVPKNVNNMSIKCFIAFIIDLKSFGGQTSKNVQDIRKLVFTCASESLYVCLVFMCCLDLNVSVVASSTLIDILRVKMFGYDSLGTTQRSPKDEPNIGQEAAQGSMHRQE